MGLGAWEASPSHRPTGSGWWSPSFDQAVYLRFPAGLAVVTAPGVAPGPLHIGAALPVTTGGTFVVPPEWTEQPTIWRGALPDPACAGRDMSWNGSTRSAGARPCCAHLYGNAGARPPPRAAWPRRAGPSEGSGPGLTPSGDDALAGMFLAAHLYGEHPEDQLVAWAREVDTHEIARAFLIWAARGQSIEPVHRLLAGDATGAVDLLAFGHSSGADLALGLHFGLQFGLHDHPNVSRRARKAAAT